MLRVFNDTARYVTRERQTQRRFRDLFGAVHADIFEFLELKKSRKEEMKARDLFFALWIPDLS